MLQIWNRVLLATFTLLLATDQFSVYLNRWGIIIWAKSWMYNTWLQVCIRIHQYTGYLGTGWSITTWYRYHDQQSSATLGYIYNLDSLYNTSGLRFCLVRALEKDSKSVVQFRTTCGHHIYMYVHAIHYRSSASWWILTFWKFGKYH